MMDMIELAREIGRQLQQDDRYIAFGLARQASDEDGDLQEMIGDFNLKRMAISTEAQNEERDEEKIRTLNTELREVYAKIMENEHMQAYNNAKNELDALVQRIGAIINMSAQGEDPDTCDYDAASCSGDCSSCGGCH